MTVNLTPREVRLLLDAAAHYDAQVRPPGVAHLRSAGRKLLAAELGKDVASTQRVMHAW